MRRVIVFLLGTRDFVAGALEKKDAVYYRKLTACNQFSAWGHNSAALLLLRMCVHPISDYLLRGLFPGGRGEQDRYAEPTHFLVKRHHALLQATVDCALGQVPPDDTPTRTELLARIFPKHVGLPISQGGFGMRAPSTVRLPAWVGARTSVLHLATRHPLAWQYFTRPDTAGAALYEALQTRLNTDHDTKAPPFPANADPASMSIPADVCQNILQKAVDGLIKNELLTLSNVTTEDLVRLSSVLHKDNCMHRTFKHPVYRDRFASPQDLLMPRITERGYCMAWCRRFGLQSRLVSPDAPHAPSCHSAAGINGAHATVCLSTAGERTYRHNRLVRNFAKVARRTGYHVHTNGPSSTNSFEYSFGTDENGQPTDLRSDLVITDTNTGDRHCLDVTFTDPSAKINMAGANPSTAAGLERLYKAHRLKYAKICSHHGIKFHTLAFDTLGRAHRSSRSAIEHLFTHRVTATNPSRWPTDKVLRVLADGLHSSSSACVLRACGVHTHDRPRRSSRSRATGG